MPKLTYNSIMPFGVHKGKAMANIPAHYLMYLWRVMCNNTLQANSDVSVYIYENLADLKNDAEKHPNTFGR